MYTIVVTCDKGGVGKSTVTRILGAAAMASGLTPVCLVDTDEQGSLLRWHRKRIAQGIEDSGRLLVASAQLREVGHVAQELKSAGASLVVIDTPPKLTGIDTLAELADTVIIPVRPDVDDIELAVYTAGLVCRHVRRYAFCVTQGRPVRLAREGEDALQLAVHELAQLPAGGTPLIAPSLSLRTAHAEALVVGQTVVETEHPDHGARVQAESLWHFVASNLLLNQEVATT